jgi:hypothetical protein
MMANKHLATYLNDHLAGSVAALNILAHLETEQNSITVAPVITALRADIEADQRELETLMKRMQIPKSAPRQAVAWLGEKVAQLKLQLDDPADGALRLLEVLETLALGILGKRALWQALHVAGVPGFQDADYERLVQRAEDQHRRAEAIRLEAARAALSDPM